MVGCSRYPEAMEIRSPVPSIQSALNSGEIHRAPAEVALSVFAVGGGFSSVIGNADG